MNCILRSYDARQAAREGKELTLTDRTIFTVSDPLVHSEFQFSERHDDYSFSATMRNDYNCVRVLQIDYTIHPKRWPSLILPMTDEQEDMAWAGGYEIIGLPYDTIGVASLGSPWEIIKPHPDKYWCSEAVAVAIKAAYGYGDDFKPDSFHPNSLYFEMLRRVGQAN